MNKKRRRQLDLVKRGWLRYLKDKKRRERKKKYFLVFRSARMLPPLSPCMEWLAQVPGSFAEVRLKKSFQTTVTMKVPRIFSLTENEAESFFFVKELFLHLKRQDCETLFIDYGGCEKIDLDASVCMDIMLIEFNQYFRKLDARSINRTLQEVKPKNFEKEQIRKILFSIGAFRNVKGIKIDYEDIVEYPLCCRYGGNINSYEQMEIDVTSLVDYISHCTHKMKRPLSSESDRNFLRVVGEVMANAQEHSTTKHRYSIGYFQEEENHEGHIGVFNLVILNFGDSIYEKFKKHDCPNKKVVKQMEDLTSSYTNKGWWEKANFREETLWTLYSLQEGVTSSTEKRGSGTVTFIEHFFNLKGDSEFDSVSRLDILSGHARIVFDGTYRIVEKERGSEKTKFKMITFNSSGNIEEIPDKAFVKHSDNYFPGTIIVAKILIKDQNIQPEQNGN